MGFDDWDFSEDTHKLLLGIVAGFLVRFLYDKWAANGSSIPSSDATEWRHIERIDDGIGGVKKTLQNMAALVRRDAGNQQLRDVAMRIVTECPGHDFDCEIRSLFEFVNERITYRRDPYSVERVQDAKRTLQYGTADCDCKCVLLATLLATLGFRSRFIVCGFRVDLYSHVYLEVLTSHGWLALDPTPERNHVGWQAPAPYRATYEIFQ